MKKIRSRRRNPYDVMEDEGDIPAEQAAATRASYQISVPLPPPSDFRLWRERLEAATGLSSTEPLPVRPDAEHFMQKVRDFYEAGDLDGVVDFLVKNGADPDRVNRLYATVAEGLDEPDAIWPYLFDQAERVADIMQRLAAAWQNEYDARARAAGISREKAQKEAESRRTQEREARSRRERAIDAQTQRRQAVREKLAELQVDVDGDASNENLTTILGEVEQDETFRDANVSWIIRSLPVRPRKPNEIDLRDLLVTIARKRDDDRIETLIRSHNNGVEVTQEEAKRVWSMHLHIENQLRNDLKMQPRDELRAQNRVFQAIMRTAERAARSYTSGRRDIDPTELASVAATNCFTKLGSFRGEAAINTWVHRGVYNAFAKAITRGTAQGIDDETLTEKQRAYLKRRAARATTVAVPSVAFGGLGLTGTAGMATTSSVPSTPEEAKVLEELGVDIITIERETPDAQEIFGDIEVEEGGFGGSTRAEPKFAETYTRFAPDEEPDFFFDDLEMESMRVLGPEERAQLRAEIEEQKAERAERMERIAHNLREQLKAQMEVWHSAEGEKEDAIVEEAYQKLKPALQKVLDVRRPEFYTLPTGERVVRVPPNYLLAQALGMNPNTYNRKLGEARKALLESVGEKVKPPYTGQLAQAYLALAAQGRRVKPKADGESVQIEYDYVDPSTGKVDLAPHEKASVEIAVPFDEARFQSLLRFFRDEQAAREAYDAGMKAPPPVRQRPPKPRPVLALSQGEQEAVGPLKAVPESQYRPASYVGRVYSVGEEIDPGPRRRVQLEMARERIPEMGFTAQEAYQRSRFAPLSEVLRERREQKRARRQNPEIRGFYYADPWELLELWEEGHITQDEYDTCMEQLVKELEVFAA